MVIIIGANLTGLCTALALSKLGEEVILVDSKDIAIPPKGDGRAIALSYGSKQILEEIDAWSSISKFAGPIKQIRVTDQYSPLFLHFNNNETLGFLVEMHNLQKALYEIALKMPQISIIAKTECNLIENTRTEAVVKINNKNYSSNLVIAADGKFSKVRETIGIKTIDYNYHQKAIVCKVRHELKHHNIAQEIFLPSGPFAILPLKNQQESSIVWTEKTDTANILLNLEKQKFLYFLKQKFTDYLGEIEIMGPIMAYPLELKIAQNYYHNRVALIGDSAHSIHPIAGQGFNLATRDILLLMKLHKKYNKIGLEFGCYQSLQEYQKLRKLDNNSMAIITDGLNKIFSNDIFPLNIARKAGLYAVNQIPFLQKFFMNYAMAKLSKRI